MIAIMGNVNFDRVPEEFCVICVPNSYLYLHYDNGAFCLIDKMTGCLCMERECAERIVHQIKGEFYEKLIVKNFKDAYKKHGMIERQIMYN